jgi:hypothetical protein
MGLDELGERIAHGMRYRPLPGIYLLGVPIMDRMLRWLVPLMIVVQVTLVSSGRLDVSSTVDVGTTFTELLLLAAGRHLFNAYRAVRQASAAGCTGWNVLEDGLVVFVPRRVAASLIRAVRRRRDAPAPGASASANSTD